MRIDARVDRVTVFESGARVTRIARLARRRGDPSFALPPRVIAAGLPLGLVDDSVQVTARGATALTATVLLEAPGADDSLPEAIPAVLRNARRAASIADGEVERVRHEIEAIEKAKLVTEAHAEQPPAAWIAVTAARRALMEMRQARLRELRVALLAAAAHAQDCARTLRAITDAEARRSDARSPRAQELRKSIAIELVHGEEAGASADQSGGGDAPADIELVIEYAVRGARWAPSYVARYQDGQLHWTIRALLAQQTGEDWTGVALRLSTAALDGHSELPELAALKIGKRQQPVARRLRPPPPGVDDLFADYDRDLRRPPKKPAAAAKPIVESRSAPPPAPEPEVVLGGAIGASFGASFDELPIEQARAPDKKSRSGNRKEAPPPPASKAFPIGGRRSAAMEMDEPLPSRAPGGAGGAPPMMKAAMIAAAASAGGAEARSMARLRHALGGDAGGDEPRREEAAPAEPRAQFDYVGLVMAGGHHGRRGHLVAMSVVERYRAPAGVDADEVRRRLDEASRAAAGVEQASLPRGTSARWSHDFDYALDAEGRVDVPSDGGWHSVPVLARAAPAAIAHVAVPREATEVFRTARSANPFDAPILPGPVDVYDGERFLVTAAVPVAAPGGELVLPLGVDPTIKLARNCEFREEVTGMLRGTLRLLHELRVEVQNTSAAPIDLEVRERVPVPRQRDSDDITVELGAVQPAWEAWTPPPASASQPHLRGGYRWRLKVAPRSTAKLSAAYEVRIAGKHELTGGNRREP